MNNMLCSFGPQSTASPRDNDWSNPIYDVYREARDLWPDRHIQITSIGHTMYSLRSQYESEQFVCRFKESCSEARGLEVSRYQLLERDYDVDGDSAKPTKVAKVMLN